MITLYTDSSPNGFKITIALEELNIAYKIHHVNIDEGENKHPEFLKLNPYGRIPVIVDDETGVTLFESAAILLYLAEKTKKLLPKEEKARWQAVVWLMFHSSTMGPLLGQRVHFEMLAKIKYKVAIERYHRISEEIFITLDDRLSDNQFFAGDEYSIADIATFGWTHIAQICDISFHQYPNLTRWHNQVAKRTAVQRGIILPAPAKGP